MWQAPLARALSIMQSDSMFGLSPMVRIVDVWKWHVGKTASRDGIGICPIQFTGKSVYQLSDNGRLMVFSSVDADDYPSMMGKRVGVAVRMQAPQPN